MYWVGGVPCSITACAFTAEARLSLRHDTHRPLCDDCSRSNSNGDSDSDKATERICAAKPSTSQAHPTLDLCRPHLLHTTIVTFKFSQQDQAQAPLGDGIFIASVTPSCPACLFVCALFLAQASTRSRRRRRHRHRPRYPFT